MVIVICNSQLHRAFIPQYHKEALAKGLPKRAALVETFRGLPHQWPWLLGLPRRLCLDYRLVPMREFFNRHRRILGHGSLLQSCTGP